MTEKSTYEELEKRVQELEHVEYKLKRAEEALQENEGRYRAVVEGMPALICSFLPGGEITFVNKAYCEYFDELFEELIGTNFLSLIPESEHKAVVDNISALTVESPSQSHEHTVIVPNGDIRWQRWTNRALFDDQGQTVGYQSIGMDITEHKETAEALRQERNMAQKLLDIAGVMFVAIDAKGEVTLVNQKGSTVLGYERKEIIGKNWFTNFLPVRLKDQTKTVFSRLMAGEIEPIEYYENPVLTKIGDERIIAWHNTILKDDEGRISGTLSSGEDITERKQAEEGLRESEERLRAILEANPDPVVMYDTEGHPQYLNPAFTEVFGWTIDELRRQRIPYVPHDQMEITAAKIKEVYALGKTARIETQRLTKQGDIIDVILSAAGIKGPKGKIVGLVVNMTDVTEKIKIESQLQRSQKMESLGLLAGSVAHDLNNVLSGIVSYPELLLLDLPEDSKLRKPIETMHESGNRAVSIVQDLLTVARGVATTKEPLNLNDIVSDYLNSPEFKKLEHFHSTVTVKTKLDTDLLNLNGSHVHIRKVVMNLVSNASEAIEGSGNVTISTMNRYVDRPQRGYDVVNIGEYVVLSVSDNGSGISPDDLARIFEPFYTKKVLGRSGTGLGLAVVWNTVQDHKGYIDVTSNEIGTTFELYFPITRDEISDIDLFIPTKDYKGNGETILVIDDVESQREISCKMLETLGYKTKAVSSGEEAVEYLKENTLDLLLLDMIMDPGMNGRETYERIIEIRPNQKAIIISGFAETDEVKEAQKLGVEKYIKKPFTLEKIGLAVKEVLGK